MLGAMLSSAPDPRSRSRALTGLLALLAVACGGVVNDGSEREPPVLPTTAPPAGPPPGETCTSAFTCPDGERCDDGVCRPDTTCPAAIAPRLLYENKSGSMESWVVSTMLGRDFVQLTATASISSAPRQQETFLDLSTGAATSWKHEPGLGFLWPCGERVCSALFLAGGGMRQSIGLAPQGGVWTGAEHVAPAGAFLYADERLVGGGKFLIDKAGELLAWAPTMGLTESVVALEGRELWTVVETPQGWQALGRVRDVVAGTDTYSTAPLKVGSSWSPLFVDDAPVSSIRFPVRVGGQWYVVHGEGGPNNLAGPFRVYRADPGGLTDVGVSSDVALRDIAYPVGGGEGPRLRDGRVGWDVSCVDGRCRLVSVDFDTAQVTERAPVELGVPAREAVRRRWLACNAVDVLIGAYVDDPSSVSKVRPTSLWYARLVPGQ